MPGIICSFERATVRFFFDYSTVVDAPTSCAMTLFEYRRYYRKQNGQAGMDHLAERLTRAIANGSSAFDRETLADMVALNRAGKGETRLTVDELIDLVMTNRKAPWGIEPAETAHP